MSTRSRLTRRSTTSTANANSTTETSPSSSPSATSCVICSTAPSKKIIRDLNFQKVIRLFLNGCLGVDVKPTEYTTFELCDECYDLLTEFYDTEDAMTEYEKHMKAVRRNIISRTLKGIQNLKKNGKTILPIHEKVVQTTFRSFLGIKLLFKKSRIEFVDFFLIAWGSDPNKLSELLKEVKLVKLK